MNAMCRNLFSTLLLGGALALLSAEPSQAVSRTCDSTECTFDYRLKPNGTTREFRSYCESGTPYVDINNSRMSSAVTCTMDASFHPFSDNYRTFNCTNWHGSSRRGVNWTVTCED